MTADSWSTLLYGVVNRTPQVIPFGLVGNAMCRVGPVVNGTAERVLSALALENQASQSGLLYVSAQREAHRRGPLVPASGGAIGWALTSFDFVSSNHAPQSMQ